MTCGPEGIKPRDDPRDRSLSHLLRRTSVAALGPGVSGRVAADAVSGARPGARRETLEKYIERLEKLEAIANSFGGVERSYAIQAGREIRVIVQSDKVDDAMSAKMCWDIARQIERELSYPGEVKVTLLRETRVEEMAHRSTGKGWAEKKRQESGHREDNSRQKE